MRDIEVLNQLGRRESVSARVARVLAIDLGKRAGHGKDGHHLLGQRVAKLESDLDHRESRQLSRRPDSAPPRNRAFLKRATPR